MTDKNQDRGKGPGNGPGKGSGKTHLFDDPKNVKRAIYALFGVSGVSLGLDFLVDRHVDHPWEGLFGFYAVYGFVACVILVLVAKEMRKALMRKDDYYDD